MPPKKSKRRKVRKDKKQDSKIKALEKFVYKTIETKQIDYHGAFYFGNVGQSQRLPIHVLQGTGDGGFSDALNPETARIGNDITLMSQDVRMIIARANSAGSPTLCRILLVESVNGSQTLNFEDVVQYGNYTTYGDQVFNSPYKTGVPQNLKYKVHMDKVFTLAEGAAGSHPSHKIIRQRITNFAGGKNKVVSYDNNLSTEPNNHRLQCLFICDKVAGGASEPRLSMAVRSRYKDA